MKKYLMALFAIGIGSSIPFSTAMMVCLAAGWQVVAINVVCMFGIIWIMSAVAALIVTLMATLRKKSF